MKINNATAFIVLIAAALPFSQCYAAGKILQCKSVEQGQSFTLKTISVSNDIEKIVLTGPTGNSHEYLLEGIKKIPLIKEKQNIEPQNFKKEHTESKTTISNKVEEYKVLKKRMSQDFKVITKNCIKEENLPSSSLVERFRQDSIRMCSYPGKGEDFYKAYLKQVEVLYQYFKGSDLKAMNLAINALNRIKKECHSKHK